MDTCDNELMDAFILTRHKLDEVDATVVKLRETQDVTIADIAMLRRSLRVMTRHFDSFEAALGRQALVASISFSLNILVLCLLIRPLTLADLADIWTAILLFVERCCLTAFPDTPHPTERMSL